MSVLLPVVVVLVLLGTVLSVAEASLSRMTRVRALSLVEANRRNAALLARLENEPARYLNAIYFLVLCIQNATAILVALLAEHWLGTDLGVMVASVAFTLLYFVVVEAMAKTFGIQHSDAAALALAPLVYALSRLFAWPTRLLIGLANVLLPGPGLRQGPFVSEEEIRALADVGHQEGSIEEEEKELIHSIFKFGDTIVREVMVPRPDIVAVASDKTLADVQDVMLEHGVSRVPVYRDDLDHAEGVLHAQDVLRAVRQGRTDAPLLGVARPMRFVPESKRVAELLREMQRDQFHQALVTDEYGAVSGLVTLEDVLEELVGEIADERDAAEPDIEELDDHTWRVSGGLALTTLNDRLGTALPREEWDTVGGLLQGLLGAIPVPGQETRFGDLVLRADVVHGRRVDRVLLRREPAGARQQIAKPELPR